MSNIPGWCVVLATVPIAALLPVPATAGRVEIKNEISNLPGRKAKLAVRYWSNKDDLGWGVIKPGEARSWTLTTMNMWPFKKTEFRWSGLGTTNEDIVTIFPVREGFREHCSVNGCIWVAKRDGFYRRRVVKNGDYFKYPDVRRSKWVWKW
ncbi:hypothetical protein AALP_AA8G115900 [Arabis alpina]|uniref:Uncharacterized protein n=1 Tax=Arabis alpina TaxID=50452 RepID=A0A087G6E1_ARAAL|nr:hypothetical protein AALP_AA8G115900 [Arabis alpina]